MGLRTLALSVTTAVVLAASTLLAGATPAQAELVRCTDDNFVHLKLHDDPNGTYHIYCYANAGTYATDWKNFVWAIWLRTGNNVVRLQDCNNTWYGWHDRYTETTWD